MHDSAVMHPRTKCRFAATASRTSHTPNAFFLDTTCIELGRFTSIAVAASVMPLRRRLLLLFARIVDQVWNLRRASSSIVSSGRRSGRTRVETSPVKEGELRMLSKRFYGPALFSAVLALPLLTGCPGEDNPLCCTEFKVGA